MSVTTDWTVHNAVADPMPIKAFNTVLGVADGRVYILGPVAGSDTTAVDVGSVADFADRVARAVHASGPHAGTEAPPRAHVLAFPRWAAAAAAVLRAWRSSSASVLIPGAAIFTGPFQHFQVSIQSSPGTSPFIP